MDKVAETDYLKKLFSTVGHGTAHEECKKRTKGSDHIWSNYHW